MENNSKGQRSKNKIIECSAYLFLRNGYNNTGIKEILKETNLPKGSFYYHFESKKHLAIEVSKYYREKMGNWLLEISSERNWEEFVEKLIDDIVKDASEEKYLGCPFAVLASEMAFIEPEILKYYTSPMENLILIFKRVFENSKVSEEEIESKSKHAFALFEGYVMYYRTTKDIKVLETLRNQLKEI